MTIGTLESLYPDIRIIAKNNTAEFVLRGGFGYVPITIMNLDSPSHFTLMIDGTPLDQSIHGNDYWQTGFDSVSKTWSHTFTVPVLGNQSHSITFSRIE